MITREQRRKLEAEWSSEDQSIATLARLIKGTVLGLLVLGLTFAVAGQDNAGRAHDAAATGAAQAAVKVESSSVRAAQQVFAERRAQWEQLSAAPRKTASR